MKQLILKGVENLGLNRLSRFWTRRCLLGLCYHGVVQNQSPPNDARTRIAVTVSQLEEQLRELRKHWNPVSSQQIRDAIEKEIPLPDRAVHVSFDDGYSNNLLLAAPLLNRYEIPATLFVTTNFIETQNQLIWSLELHERLSVFSGTQLSLAGQLYSLDPPETPKRTEQALQLLQIAKSLPMADRETLLQFLRERTKPDLTPKWKRELYTFLSWDELRSLQKKGIEIGAHTLSHPILSQLQPQEIDRELRESKNRLETELNKKCDLLAYPFGSENDFSDLVVNTARNIGFRLAFTLQEKRNNAQLDAMRIHRICIHRELSLASFQALISGVRNALFQQQDS
ncbi:MAG: polysaccharide deacetylase family protein [Planctomycetaceae bacterium]|nr:polysaccharide deacetylase family protein [Planctomycetaceae bacterium]